MSNREFFCPNCNAILNDQPGFDPSIGVWTCTECGQCLYGDEVASTMQEFDGVVWYCDSCGAVLSLQAGFYDSCGTWYCTNCGYANQINKDEIYESEEDYQSKNRISESPNCGHTDQLIEEKTNDSEDDYQSSNWTFECPYCGSILNSQTGFDEDRDTFTCIWCDTKLYWDGDEYVILESDYDYDVGEDEKDEDEDEEDTSSFMSVSSPPSKSADESSKPVAEKGKKDDHSSGCFLLGCINGCFSLLILALVSGIVLWIILKTLFWLL